MKNYLIARTQGNVVAAIIWDKAEGTMKLKVTGPSEFEVRFTDLDIEQGIENWGAIYWQGQMFQVSRFHHDELVSRFPTLDIDGQYRLADAWCVKVGKEIKNSYQFMSNWCKKARGGNVARGNVQL